jgi:hypothetical protein
LNELSNTVTLQKNLFEVEEENKRISLIWNEVKDSFKNLEDVSNNLDLLQKQWQ